MTMTGTISRMDIQRLREIPIEPVAESLGISVQRHTAICPFHSDTRPSLVFSRRTNTFRCYACGEHGDVIDLMMRCRGMGFIEACAALGCRDTGMRQMDPIKTAQGKADKAPYKQRAYRQESDPDLCILQSMVEHPVITDEAARFLYGERRISPEVVRWAGISSIATGQTAAFFNAPALLIPYRDIFGQLQTVQARYLGNGTDRPRFQFPRGTHCHIYGMEVLRLLEEGEPLFITEGVTDCLAMMSSGRKAVAIPSATLLNPSELAPLRGLNLHICPDSDEPGEHLYLQLREALLRMGTTLVKHRLPEGYKDFAQWWCAHSKNNIQH